MITPSKADFLARAGSRRIAVVADLISDFETPLGAYWKIAHDQTASFLLESISGGEQVARYSILGSAPTHELRSTHSGKQFDGSHVQDAPEDPLEWLTDVLKSLEHEGEKDLPKFFGGAVGFLTYDYVRRIESLPTDNPDLVGLPEMSMMIFDHVVVFDHVKNRTRMVVLADPTPEGYDHALATIRETQDLLQRPLPELPMESGTHHVPQAHTTKAEFCAAVDRVREYIMAGDCIQVVPSQRWSQRTEAHPLSIYRALRTLNPSPYMFLLRFADFDVIGASPEILVSATGREARVRPIAGTRKRGATELEDAALESDLLADEKERAEHIMLVDLGRNDLGRVCEPGTVHVQELMVIERYSHVMHIVSDIRGQLKEGETVVGLVRAAFPAGTLSGAPKVRAMQIIEEVEPIQRGLYGGAVGYLTPSGDADLAIAIRSIVLKDGVAHVQAGAGIVFDSDPEREYQETLDKASAALRAIRMAESGDFV